MLIGVIVGCLAVLAYVALGTWLLLPLPPPVSWKQGKVTAISGRVTQFTKIAPGVYEFSLAQEADIDARALEEPGLISMSVTVTMFIHQRDYGLVNPPPFGRLLKVYTQNRLYPFRRRSYNWVKNWEVIDDIPAQDRPQVRRVPAEPRTGIMIKT